MKQSPKRRAFTLIELVMALAILGVLSLAIIQQYRIVAGTASLRVFDTNCHAVASAISMYQSGHKGAYPKNTTELGEYINGGWSQLNDNPIGAVYQYNYNYLSGVGTFTASFTDDAGVLHTFVYPD